MLPVQEGKFPLYSLGFCLGLRIKLTEARLTGERLPTFWAFTSTWEPLQRSEAPEK